jgi:hypothetical protein
MIQVMMSDDEFELLMIALAKASATEADTSMIALGNALEGPVRRSDELRRAVEFFDRVKAASEDEKIAVGHDHWDRLESAARDAVAPLQASI